VQPDSLVPVNPAPGNRDDVAFYRACAVYRTSCTYQEKGRGDPP